MPKPQSRAGRLTQRASALLEQHPWSGPVLAGGLHLLAAVGYVLFRDVSIMADPFLNAWDAFWQNLPMSHLGERPLESLWFLHAQPPLFNLLGWFLNVVFGDAFLKALHALHIALGACMVGMACDILRVLTGRPLLSTGLALLMALNPALFLFEAFIMYSLLTAFLVMALLFAMARYQEHGKLGWVYAATALAVLLVLTRGVFHVAVLVPIIWGGCLLAAAQWKRYLRIALLLALVPLAWYTKNAIVFGFWGASSWAGSNLWRIASTTYSETELRQLYASGLLDEAAAKRAVFERPSEFEEFGFDRRSPVPVLARNDFHNLNMVAISRMHGQNAVRLIRHDPWRYLDNVRRAYLLFCKLSYETRPLQANRGRLIHSHVTLNEWLHGTPLMQRWGQGGTMQASSLYVVAIPLCLLLFAWKALRIAGRSTAQWKAFFRSNPVYWAAILVIALVVLVSACFEYGENCRFKFAVMLPIQVCLFALLAGFLAPRGAPERPAESP